MSQNAQILKHLKAGKSITAMEAFRMFGVCVLHSRISELRGQGHRVNCQLVKTPSGKRVGKYRLGGR